LKRQVIAILGVVLAVSCCQPASFAKDSNSTDTSGPTAPSSAEWQKVGDKFGQAGAQLLKTSVQWLEYFLQKTHQEMDNGMNGLQHFLGQPK